MAEVINVNVGVLGHVDSGKTSLVKALSTTASTAAFDKNPQSKERGITLDLGFSSFRVPSEDVGTQKDIQFTLVDCPGHASLIRTVIGGAQIIDLMILVIDVTKGMQTQTAECLIIGKVNAEDEVHHAIMKSFPGEVCVPSTKLVAVLNKLDQVPEEKRQATVEKMKKKLSITLSRTKFKNSAIVATSALEGQTLGIKELVNVLTSQVQDSPPSRKPEGDFVFSVDHCFNVRGQGTVMTGTVLGGKVEVNDVRIFKLGKSFIRDSQTLSFQNVEICAIGESRKVKSMQMFKKSVKTASQGDRVGVCVTQFDAKKLERGLVCTPGFVQIAHGGIVDFNAIKFFKVTIASKSKYHISLGHETVLGKITLFKSIANDAKSEPTELEKKFANMTLSDKDRFTYLPEITEEEQTDVPSSSDTGERGNIFAIIEFERPTYIVPNCQVLGSRLDFDSHSPTCRLAFHGKLLTHFKTKDFRDSPEFGKFNIFTDKAKEGVVERANNAYEVICKNMFKKETKMDLYFGLKVKLSTGEEGEITDTFGQSGKFKVSISGNGLSETTQQSLAASGKGKGKDKSAPVPTEPKTVVKLFLNYKKNVFSKKITQ